MSFPFGDHVGFFSCAPAVFVRLNTSPLPAGTVTISPLKSITTLAPDGEISPSRMYWSPFIYLSRWSNKSAAMPIFNFDVLLFAGL